MSAEAFIVQPWLQAGLQFLLVQDEARVRELEGKAMPSRADAKTSADVPLSKAAPLKTGEDGNAYVQPAVPVKVGTAQQAAQDRPREHRDEQTALLPFAQWGEDWQALWNRLNMPPRPMVLWTYASLGQDLTQAADPARRKVLGGMLAELHHPKGTHVFWPYSLPGAENCPEIFWSAVSLLAPRALLILGSDARDMLGLPKSLRPFCQERVRGRMVIQLHRPENLASDSAAFRSSVVFLSQILHFCASRTPGGRF